MQVRELNNKLQSELAKKAKSTANDNKDSRFVTFLPQDKQKHQEEQNSVE